MEPNPVLRLYVLPGGKLPERQSPGAIGYDACLRAIVSPCEMDPKDSRFRRTLFDFLTVAKDLAVAQQVRRVDGELVYRLEPGESVLGGIGFITEMPSPMFYWVAPRSGLASRQGITVTNAPGTVE